IRVGKSLSDVLSVFMMYELSTSKLTNVSPQAIPDVLDVEGETQLQSLLNPSIVYDSRNNRRFPTNGILARLSPTVSGGPLGGDIDVASVSVDFRQYHSVGEKLRIRFLRKLVWSYRVEARYIDAFDGSLPAFRRLFLGGRRAVRGFQRDDLGPRDSNGEAIGGFSTGLVSTEISHPFFGPTRLVVFLDAGNVWERHNAFDVSDIRIGGGFGVRFITPLGPVRIDLGYKLDKKSGERPREVHVGIGTSF
ncbi:MAG: BamA/TamA family outer membrane protein, partial [bacterium]